MKEIGKIIKDENLVIKKEIKKEDDYEKKFGYTEIIILNPKIVCAFSEDGYIYTFKIDDSCMSGAHLFTIKAHENKIISSDIIKSDINKFITSSEVEIKIWKLINKNNNY